MASLPCFRICDLRSTCATRLSAGGVADEFVTQLLRQGDAKVFKKFSPMKLQMKREALALDQKWGQTLESQIGKTILGEMF